MWNSTGKKLQTAAFICLFVLAVSLFVTLTSAPSEAAEFGTITDFTRGMLDNFRTKFQSFEDRIHRAALSLFAVLFLCQFAWSLIQLMLTESLTFASVITAVIRQVMTGMFFYWLLFDRSILKGIVDSFSQLANAGLSFTELLYFCETAIYNLMTAVQSKGGLTLEGISLFFSGLAASLVMSYAMMTAIGCMAVVLLENYIAGSLGLILLGFGGSEYTRNYALSYIRTLVHIGFKLFLVTIIIRVGAYAFARTTGGMIGNEADSLIETCLMLIGQSFLFLAVIKVIPQIADTLISGVSMNTASGAYALRSGAAGAAGLTAGAASVMYNQPGRTIDAAGGGISAVRSAASAYSTSFNTSKSQGFGSIRAGVSALGSTIWSGYQASRGNPGVQNSMTVKSFESGTSIGSVTSSPNAGSLKSSSEQVSPSGFAAIENSRISRSTQTQETQQTQVNSDTAKSAYDKTNSSSDSLVKSGPLNERAFNKISVKAPTPEELSKRVKKDLGRW